MVSCKERLVTGVTPSMVICSLNKKHKGDLHWSLSFSFLFSISFSSCCISDFALIYDAYMKRCKHQQTQRKVISGLTRTWSCLSSHRSLLWSWTLYITAPSGHIPSCLWPCWMNQSMIQWCCHYFRIDSVDQWDVCLFSGWRPLSPDDVGSALKSNGAPYSCFWIQVQQVDLTGVSVIFDL